METETISPTQELEAALVELLTDDETIATTVAEEQVYRDHPHISNSDMSLFRESPWALHQYKEGIYEGKTSSGFSLGTMFEQYLLEPTKFAKNYILCDVDAPTNSYHTNYCADRIRGEVPEIAYGNHYSTKNKSEKAIAKAISELEEDYKEYIEFGRKAQGKIEYNMGRSKLLSDMKSCVATHQLANRLLLEEPHDELTRFTQLKLILQHPEYTLKGGLDVGVIDWMNKKVYVVDLKTSGKPLSSFDYWAKRYRYHRQIALYLLLFSCFLKSKYPRDTYEMLMNEFDIHPVLVSVRTSGIVECRVQEVPENAILEGLHEFFELYKDYCWHKQHEQWQHRQPYYENHGLEVLNYESDLILEGESEADDGGFLGGVPASGAE